MRVRPGFAGKQQTARHLCRGLPAATGTALTKLAARHAPEKQRSWQAACGAASIQPPCPAPHLTVGCSCALMSPPFSFFSSGTTTPTAPSEAASSKFSSAQEQAGQGQIDNRA